MIFDIEKWAFNNRNITFQWGVSDCCLFTCDYVKERTGVDPAENHRGHYTTEIGAKRALIKYGSIENSFDAHFERIGYYFAKRGDVVLFNSQLGLTLGVKWSGGVLSVGYDGLKVARLSINDVIATWSITNV